MKIEDILKKQGEIYKNLPSNEIIKEFNEKVKKQKKSERIELPRLGKFLDKQRTTFSKKVYEKTGYPTGHELRDIAKELGGEWNCYSRSKDIYDVLTIPYKNGVLIIERPWQNDSNGYTGHNVIYEGENTSSLKESIKKFLIILLQKEREKSKEFYIKCLSLRPSHAIKETADEIFG